MRKPPVHDYKEFRELRKETGFSMNKMADYTNTPHGSWRNWELGYAKAPNVAIAFLKLYIYCQEQKKKLNSDFLDVIK